MTTTTTRRLKRFSHLFLRLKISAEYLKGQNHFIRLKMVISKHYRSKSKKKKIMTGRLFIKINLTKRNLVKSCTILLYFYTPMVTKCTSISTFKQFWCTSISNGRSLLNKVILPKKKKKTKPTHTRFLVGKVSESSLGKEYTSTSQQEGFYLILTLKQGVS